MPPVIKVGDRGELVDSNTFSLAKFHFEKFNPVQSRILEYYDKDNNLLVASNTGSGKTVVAEIMLAHEVRVRKGKGLYLVPLKALAQEKLDDWQDENHHFKNLKISVCTGDYRLTAERRKELDAADLIVMSYEMFNSRVRNIGSERSEFLMKVGTLVADECFPATTKVKIENNVEVSIKQIFDNADITQVLAFDESTNQVVKKNIVRKIRKKLDSGLVSVKHQYGQFTCTANHKIYTNRGYIEAGKLLEKDKIKFIPLLNDLKCVMCGKSFNKKRFLTSHYMYGHVSVGSNTKHIDKMVECDKCGGTFNVYGYDSHVRNCGLLQIPYEPKSNKCSVCGIEFLNATKRARHELHHFRNKESYLKAVETRNNNPAYHVSMKLMGKNRVGKNNPVFNNPETLEKMKIAARIRWENLSEEQKMAQITRFINAPLQKTSGTKLELFVEDIINEFNLPIRRVSGGKFWLRFKSKKNKNPDFKVNGKRKVIEVGDTEYWHTSEEIAKVIKEYDNIGYQCLYLTDKDIKKGEDHVKNLILLFLDNHESDVISVKPWGRGNIDYVYDLEIEDVHNYFAEGVLVSNCHLLTVPGRGDHLEAGMMRFTEINKDCRLVFLSATMPNVDELADWTSFILNNKQTVLLKSIYRPCPLNLHYEKYWDGERSYDDNEKQKINMALEIVEYYPDDKFLIFSHTKRTCALMKEALTGAGIKCEIHNADLDKAKRNKVEKDFKTNDSLRVVVATSTLAWGCYRHGTLIQMANGQLSKIESIMPGEKVLSFNGKSFEPRNVLRVGEKTSKHAYKITLSSGETCEVSKDHIFYAACGRKIPNWESVKDISVGDFLAVPKKYDLDKVDGFSELGYILGFAAGDGCLSLCGQFASGENKYVLDICAGEEDREHLVFVKEMLSKITDYPIPDLRSDSNGVWHIQCKAKIVTDEFVGNISVGRNKDKLIIPQWVESNRFILKSYISGLFDSDGGFVYHGNANFSLEFSTISNALANQVQQLLLGFGIRSTVGKKKNRDTVINGRLQKARRDWIWRVRTYNACAKEFESKIGFILDRKKGQLEEVDAKAMNSHNTKHLLPVRSLINCHAIANDISTTAMCEQIGNRAWSIINKKELSYCTVNKLISRFSKRSNLNDLFEADLLWSKVKKIELVKGDKFQDIEVEGLHSFVGGGILSHNCNLPARRVIILGVHRGLEEVATYDVSQMCGRAGRPAFDPVGDAYILLPEKTYDMHKARIRQPQLIQSQMLAVAGEHHKVLAFHLVSEIHQETIKNREDVHHWYKRSLACFQANELDEGVVDHTMDLLKKCGAVWEEEGQYTVTSIGKIASLFYFSPFDVSDLKKNFTALFDNNKENDDLSVAVALANLDTHRFGIVSKSEREEMSMFANQVHQACGKGSVMEPAIKTAYAYYQMLNGNTNPIFMSLTRGLHFDFPRLNQVLQAIDGFTGKWQKTSWFRQLQLRVTYGVKGPMVELCQLPHIGKVRANKLWKAGLRDFLAIINSPEGVRKATGLKTAEVDEILAEAKKLFASSS